MILDSIKNLRNYEGMHPNFKKAIYSNPLFRFEALEEKRRAP